MLTFYRIEQSLVIIIGSVPTCRPLFRHDFIKSKGISSRLKAYLNQWRTRYATYPDTNKEACLVPRIGTLRNFTQVKFEMNGWQKPGDRVILSEDGTHPLINV